MIQLTTETVSKPSDQDAAEVAAHTPTPWEYRPAQYDDWGWIRGPQEADGLRPLAALARGAADHSTFDDHRRAGTDPYAANAAFIVRAVNNHDALVASLKEMIEVYWGNGDGAEPPPTCIQRASAALLNATLGA